MPTSPSSGDLYDAASLELVIREKDIEYQASLLFLFYWSALCVYLALQYSHIMKFSSNPSWRVPGNMMSLIFSEYIFQVHIK